MNRKLKIYQLRATKFSSMSLRNSSDKKDYSRRIKYSNVFIENGQFYDFHAKNINPSLLTLKDLV